ncbi:MAG: SRPBCC family protein [Chloroflexi bacterium]|nr:MAG: SRPBCC family protein [Chloroflexota bacterium]
MRTTIGIDVAAPPELVFQLARDPVRWPSLLPHYWRAQPVAHEGESVVCEFVALRALVPVLGIGIPVAWRSRTWAEPDQRRLRFRHLGGATAGMDVTWRIEPAGDGCRVTIEHDFRPRVAVWARFVDRGFTRPIASRTLRTFKSLAETLADGSASDRLPPQ